MYVCGIHDLRKYRRVYVTKESRQQMKITLTSMQGNTRDMNFMSKQEVYEFIDLYRSTLQKNQRVKVTCDLLGIDGYLQGQAQ